MKNLISIVLPVYNGEKYLRESIDSVLKQTYSNWELLILDDCSSDSTPQIAKEYAKKDNRIKYYKNEINLKLPRNLNKGFSLAKGDYLTWTSDDNKYRPTALETMYTALKSHDKAQFAYASCRIIDENGKEIEYITVGDNGLQRIVGENVVGACFLYTRQVFDKIGEYNPEFCLVEDFDYWQRIFMSFETVGISEILYDYRWHSGALTSTMRKEQFNRTLEKMILKNIKGFGKLSTTQKYYYFKGLYFCRYNINEPKNPYTNKYRLYSLFYLFRYRIPNKIHRMFFNTKR